jgi:hypothetical protein
MDWPNLIASFLGSAIPAAAGVAMVKFLSDSVIERQKYRQSSDLQETQNTFFIGATSHMATVAFDKHIDFCEAYVEEVYDALHLLNDEGSEIGLLDTRRFSVIRERWALWLTEEIEDKLDRFELKIAQIIGGPARDRDEDGPLPTERSIKRNIAELREVLHTEDLTALRNEMVLRSSIRPRESA